MPNTYSFDHQLEGEETALDTDSALNPQIKKIPYNRKRELKRSAFQIGEELGSGAFGKVHKGIVIGLTSAMSHTTVAIKSIQETGNSNDLRDLLNEIKLMSHISPHLNLVSMIGACTSELQENGELWLIIEYCEHGELKTFLRDNKERLLRGKKGDKFNSRCLLNWAYEIAKGMEYLAEHKIMHGDLAARNIMMAEDLGNANCPIAKVADFGLSKRLYDYVEYKKESRLFVPWKWMAIEFLKDGIFTLKSDVWSYGVLVWEILSFGGNPYGQQGYDEILAKLGRGYRLRVPEDASNITLWSPEIFYKQISKKCFDANPEYRANFSEVVQLVENLLLSDEIARYNKLYKLYTGTTAGNYLKICSH